MFKYWSLLLSHESWSKSCEHRSSELVAFITTLMGCRETIFVDKSTINFPIFLHFLIESFLFFLFSQSWVSYFPIFWASWHWTPCKHSISIVHIFRVTSFKAFCKFLRLRNSARDFWGVNFCSRDFLGGFVGSPRDFFGFWCLPPFNHPITWNPEYLQPWGKGELIHKRRLFEYYKYTCMAYEVGIVLREVGYQSMSLFQEIQELPKMWQCEYQSPVHDTSVKLQTIMELK